MEQQASSFVEWYLEEIRQMFGSEILRRNQAELRKVRSISPGVSR